MALGRRIRTAITEQLAAGKPFAEIANSIEDLNGATLSTETYDAFTRLNPPEGLPPASVGSLEGLKAGDVSEMVLFPEEGVITHASARTPPNLSETDPRFIELKAQLAQLNAASTASGLMRELISGQLELSSGPAN